MPSTIFAAAVSGGQLLVSGDIFSGNYLLPHQITLTLSLSGAFNVGVALPAVGGGVATFNSGGSLTSGGLGDGFELQRGQPYTVYRGRLTSGISSIRLVGPAESSGARINWEWA